MVAQEIDPAEGDRQDGSPADADELQIANQVGEREIGGAVVEEFKGQQSGDDQQTKDHPALQTNTKVGKSEL